MIFKRYSPKPGLEKIIECYWIIENSSSEPEKIKIIPDGFTEIIFHYGDPYRICLDEEWQVQSKSLFAGQIRKYFYLENTGISGMIGIKLMPAALAKLYNISMNTFTDKVFDLKEVIGDAMLQTELAIRSVKDHDEMIHILNSYYERLLLEEAYEDTVIERAVRMILEQHGLVSVREITEMAGVGERQLELLFKRYVGLSPKFFTRIIRFSYIFQLVNDNNQSWSNVAYEAAYYDQSHFIRNFRDFTGENPTDYAFDEENIANFFLKKK